MSRTLVDMAGRRLPLSNLEKELYPSYGFTKAQVLEYYHAIAPFMLPHLSDRAVTLKRYPDGVEKEFFFEKRCPLHHPEWVRTAEVDQHNGEPIAFCLINDLATLIWAENLASLELHVPLARAGSPQTPDSMIFDLDPGEEANIIHCSRVALILRDLLSRMGLETYIKTSGNKGLHVLVPLNRKETTFEDTKMFSKVVSGMMQKHYPDLVTAKMAKQERKAKVFINWSQNDASKTMICVYSLRAREKPFVSFPIEWRELEELARLGNPDRLQVMHAEARSMTGEKGDLFREVLIKEQRLPHL
ncbi:MAG: ATP-dependent DNA ligase [Nitrospirae bacterium]|nr:ATP-dependent DNA ligase [Nitrospirota bacterium]